MATRKKTPDGSTPTPKPAPKKKTVEEVTIKSVESFTDGTQKLTAQARNVVGQLEQAFIEKRGEFDEVVEGISVAKEQLKELLTAQQIGQDLAELEIALEDAKRDHARKIDQLKIENDLAMAELRRKHDEAKTEAEFSFKEEQRARAYALEDEKRKRDQEYQSQQSEIAQQKRELQALQDSLGSFDDRLKAEVAKVMSAINRDNTYAQRAAETTFSADKRILESEIERLKRDNASLVAATERAERAVELAQQKVFQVASDSAAAFSGREARDTAEKLATESAKAPRR